jgi:putative ABC transport system permease protein
MRFLPLIVKSLLRNRRRSLLTFAGIGLSVFVASALLAVEGGFDALFSSAGASVLSVSEKGVACPFNSRVFDSYLGFIQSNPHVKDATGVLRGMYSYQNRDNLVTVSGVDFDAFQKVKDIQIKRGGVAAFKAAGNGALVGAKIAKDYRWEVGQTIPMNEDRLAFQVSGIFESSDKTYEGGVLLHKGYLEKIKRDEGKSTYLLLNVDGPSSVAPVSGFIDEHLANYPKPTKTQSERAAKERQMQDFLEIRRMLSGMLVATILVSLLGAANSVSIAVRERMREVGILRSLGLRKGQVLMILAGEPVLISLASGILGLGAAMALLSSAKSLGGMVPLVLSPKYAAVGMGVALLIGVLGALLPSLRASRTKIVDSLRFVD